MCDRSAQNAEDDKMSGVSVEGFQKDRERYAEEDGDFISREHRGNSPTLRNHRGDALKGIKRMKSNLGIDPTRRRHGNRMRRHR